MIFRHLQDNGILDIIFLEHFPNFIFILLVPPSFLLIVYTLDLILISKYLRCEVFAWQ